MKTTHLTLCILLLLVSCGQGRKDTGFHPRPFPSAEVPAIITDRSEAVSYLAAHFWDEFLDTTALYPCDSTTVNGVKRPEVEQAYANYLAILGMTSEEEGEMSVGKLFGGISAMEARDTSSNVFETIAELTKMYLYDPNSPYRNEDLYYPFVKGLSTSGFVDEGLRAGYGYDARMCSLNRTGTTAADFVFCDKAGRRYSMHGIKADYTILFFSNPGCHACKEIIDGLSSNEKVSEMISSGRLAVLNIYIDSDLSEWRRYMPVYPDNWYNGYDPDYVIREDILYNVRAIPSLYLLDKDKKVLMKDAPQERLFSWLESVPES